jgi:hypothetical protein
VINIFNLTNNFRNEISFLKILDKKNPSRVSIHIYKLDEKNLWIENTTKLSRGQVSICFGYYPTPKARQIEKILNCHVLLGMLALLQNQIASQTIYP